MTMREKPSNFYSAFEVADSLGVHEKTVRRWIKAGELPVHKIGRSVRISEHKPSHR